MSGSFYIALPENNKFMFSSLLGLTLVGRLLNEVKRAGAGKVTLLAGGEVEVPARVLEEAPEGLEVETEQAGPIASVDELAGTERFRELAEAATIIDGGCVFTGGALARMVEDDPGLGGSLKYTAGGKAALVRLGAGGGEGRMGRAKEGDRLCRRLASAADRNAARWLLLNGLRKPMLIDGVVGYYFMRPITLRITSLIARLPILPNHVTIFCMLLGIAGAALIAAANAAWQMQLGLLLYFVGATLDCVDGELARVKYKGSYLGAWLDTLADDLSTSLLVAAMGVYLTNTTGHSFYLVLGLAGAACFQAGQLYLYYFLLTVFKSGDVLDFVWGFQEGGKDEREESLTDYLLLVTKRDFFSAFLVLCSFTGLLWFGASVVSGMCVCYIALVFYDWFFHRRKMGTSEQAQG